MKTFGCWGAAGFFGCIHHFHLAFPHLLYVRHEPSCMHGFQYDGQCSFCALWESWEDSAPISCSDCPHWARQPWFMGYVDKISLQCFKALWVYTLILCFLFPLLLQNIQVLHLTNFLSCPSTFNPWNNAECPFRSEFRQSNFAVHLVLSQRWDVLGCSCHWVPFGGS